MSKIIVHFLPFAFAVNVMLKLTNDLWFLHQILFHFICYDFSCPQVEFDWHCICNNFSVSQFVAVVFIWHGKKTALLIKCHCHLTNKA